MRNIHLYQLSRLITSSAYSDVKNREQWKKSLYRIHINAKHARADDPLYQDYIEEIKDLIKSRKEEEKQSKKPPKQKTAKPFEQSLRDHSVSPKTPSKPIKKSPAKPSEEEEEEFQDASGATGLV